MKEYGGLPAEMGVPKFRRPKGGVSSNLYVANCGPALDLPYDLISSVFGSYGQIKGVYAADQTGTRVVVSFYNQVSATSAMEALNARNCPQLNNRFLHIRYSVQSISPIQANDSVNVSLEASELGIPGLYLVGDFVSDAEEKELLAAVDCRPWHCLAKRRVQHYGYEFCYNTRNVDTNQYMGELPSFVSPILERVERFENLGAAASLDLDQLTVNEYPPGVGLSPHIDTHSAFEECIFSLSLAGPCIMEFRKYQTADWVSESSLDSERMSQDSDKESNFVRRALYLPPRSMLLLSGEARYAWHHYIPHHKVDIVKENLIRRSSRRISFTLRTVRKGPCGCEFPGYCDSRK